MSGISGHLLPSVSVLRTSEAPNRLGLSDHHVAHRAVENGRSANDGFLNLHHVFFKIYHAEDRNDQEI